MNINKTLTRSLSALALAAASLGAAQAATLDIDVSGTQSFDALGSSYNTVITRTATAGALVGSLAWNVNLTALGESWLQDMRVRISNSTGEGITLTLDSLQAPGSQSYVGSANLTELGYAFNLGADGLLRLEFYEDYDDAPGQADGIWNSGTLSFDGLTAAAVPEPSSYALLGLGLLVVGRAARRRSLAG